MLGETVARRKRLVALDAVKGPTVEAVGNVSQKRLARHVLRVAPRLALLALKPGKLVFVHKVSDQQRLVGADGLIAQGTVSGVVTTLAHLAPSNMVVEHRDSLKRLGTHAARGEGVTLLGVSPLVFLFYHDVVGTARTRRLYFVTCEVDVKNTKV